MVSGLVGPQGTGLILTLIFYSKYCSAGGKGALLTF